MEVQEPDEQCRLDLLILPETDLLGRRADGALIVLGVGDLEKGLPVRAWTLEPATDTCPREATAEVVEVQLAGGP